MPAIGHKQTFESSESGPMPFNVDDSFINVAESELHVQFPAAYRAAMRQRNGGVISIEDEDWELHPVADPSDRKRLSRTLNSVVSETLAAKEWPGFPQDAVAIANNGAGDLLVFLSKGADLGPEVFVWRHETQDVNLVAADFSTLS